jgi:hypothetical protein
VNRSSRWIESPAYDLPLIALAPLLGLAVTAVAAIAGEKALLSAFFIEANFFLLGMPHYLSTYVFFLDDENARYHSTRKFAFYAGPVLVALLVTAAMALHLLIAVAAVVALWNVFHVSRQSSGILSLYRHGSAGDHAREKHPAMFGLLAANLGMFLVAVARQPWADARLAGKQVAAAGAAVVLAGAAIALIVLARLMWRRRAASSEWVFVASSILLFAPFLGIRDLMLASTAMLTGHYVQYLGLLWLLNHRKYPGTTGSTRQRFLAAVSRNPVTVVTLLVVLAVMPFGIDRIVHARNWMAFHTWWLNITVLMHFYLDGLFWAFRDPHVRRTIGPYLAPRQTARVPLEADPLAAAS